MKKSVLWLFLVAFIGTSGYFVQTAWQTHRGEDALKATALDFLPLEQALARGMALGKPVLVDFSAIWCPTCRALHAEVFTQPLVKQAITDGYVLARVDYESPEAPAFMQRYAVKAFPSLLILSTDGTLLRRVPVTFDPAAFAASLHG
jgi:protein disulfide-isomerase